MSLSEPAYSFHCLGFTVPKDQSRPEEKVSVSY